jgi:aryl sulfotransferase
MPSNLPRGFKTHSPPGECLPFRNDIKYIVVMRNPEEAVVSMFPFFQAHSEEFFAMWTPPGLPDDFIKTMLTRDTFKEFFQEVMLLLTCSSGIDPNDKSTRPFFVLVC